MGSVADKLFGFGKLKIEGDESLSQLYKKYIQIAWPSMLEGALISIIGSCDTMMVGRLGKAAISAVGLTNQPRMIIMILAQALCVGTTALVARRRGAEDRMGANAAFCQSFALITFVGILMTAIGYFLAEPLMNLSGANEDTLEMSVEYFKIVSLGYIFNCWSLCICAAMRAIGKTRITLATNLTANIVNVCMNYCLIGGHFGFPALGVKGAAIATLIGTIVASIMALFVALKKGGYLRLNARQIFHWDKLTMSSLSSVGSSSIAESAFLRIGFLITNKMVAELGTDAFAAYQIVSQVTGLSFTLGDGLATAGSTLVGQSLGAERKDLAKANVVISRKLSIITSILLMIAIFIFREGLGMLFTDDEKIISDVALGFLTVMIGVFPQNGRVVYSGCLRGAGDTKYVAVCALLSVTILRPVLTYVLCYPLNTAFPVLVLSVTGPWLAFVIDAFIRNYLLGARIRKGKWVDIKL